MAALPILEVGHCLRVGNGSSIRVLRDRWIPNYRTNKVLHPNHDLLGEMAISDLINSEINVWRSEFIHSNFHRDDAKAIC